MAVAVIGSLTALTHAERMRQSHGSSAMVWMTAGGITLGMAIWSMHFIGMLAFHLPVAISYDLLLTLLSLIPAIAAAMLCFYVLHAAVVSELRIIAAGVIMGLGIATMHYTGMAALKMSPAIEYSPSILTMSILIAILASWAALLMMYRGDQLKIRGYLRLGLGSLVMGLAISGMHYSAMQGLVIAPGSVCQAGVARIERDILAVIVTLTSLLWFGGGILAALFDHRMARQNASALQQLQLAHASLEKSAALRAASMTQVLSESERKMRSVVEGALDCIIMMDEAGNIVEFNPAAERTFGYTRAQVLGKNLAEVIIPPTMREQHNDGIQRLGRSSEFKLLGKRFELNAMRIDGSEFPMELAITAFDWEGSQLLVGFLRDITDRKLSESEIHSLAFYDPLTKLPNRRLLRERLQYVLSAGERHQSYSAILFIDLDNFKTLNDTRGHDVGDLLLIEVATRLQACVRFEDTVARLGGDEFVVVLDRIHEDEKQAAILAEIVAEKIRNSLGQLYLIKDFEHYSTPSIGICMFANQEMSVDELLKRADTAMYQAKHAGRNTVRFFDPEMQAVLEARTRLENDLRVALENQQFKIFLQMQVDAHHRICGAEALLRWQHPEHGCILPNEFISLAEESGFILSIGQWVLESACAQLKEWESSPQKRNITLSVNVSARQFRQPGFVQQVRTTIEKFNISPQKLKLELTESLIFDNATESVEKMLQLCAVGISFSMDDFGTGYSSISYLKKLPLSQIKIDQSFVHDLTIDHGDDVIVQTIIIMAHNLGLEVVAEGVETPAQFEFLRVNGCNIFQGNLFEKPIAQEEFNQIISTGTLLKSASALDMFAS